MYEMSHTTCDYHAFPLDPHGDATTDKDVHSPFRVTPEEEPCEEDPGHRPNFSGLQSERRHRPWAYFQC
jgi:hypothetical protein